MNEEARELAEKWGCTPSNTCYWYCVGAAQREIDDGENIVRRSLQLSVGESSGRAGSAERLAAVLNIVQACQVPRPWTLEGHFPADQNIPLDAGGHAIAMDHPALTEEDVYELANRYVDSSLTTWGTSIC
jgi:hypothetical protein